MLATAPHRAVITKHPVTTFFALTFAISWGAFVVVVGPGGFPGTGANSTRFCRSSPRRCLRATPLRPSC
jgi:hypothetical protein